MAKHGGRSNLKPFKYPGREPVVAQKFLEIRPDLRDFYVYDILLSSGEFLYSCAGGMGVTDERYLVDMHRFLSKPTSIKTLRDTAPLDYTRRKYHSLREKFNERSVRIQSLSHCSELYWLWLGSNFSHRYRDFGYDGVYSPTTPDYTVIANCSQLSREKRLIFRQEGLSKFSESIINDQTVVYAHFPSEFGRYGANFLWNERTLSRLVRIFRELSDIGYKVCVSAQYEKRGLVQRDYVKMMPFLSHVVVPQFKVSELTFETTNSEIYLLNF
jgi:hypothetical protein